jgi:hypothetical protein
MKELIKNLHEANKKVGKARRVLSEYPEITTSEQQTEAAILQSDVDVAEMEFNKAVDEFVKFGLSVDINEGEDEVSAGTA